MLLHRCSCGREYLPNGIHMTWHKHIGRIPAHILRDFCRCKPPNVSASEARLEIDYDDLKKAIILVGSKVS